MSRNRLGEMDAITPLGREVFQELLTRKKEEDHLKKKARMTGWILIIFAAGLVGELFIFQAQQLTSLRKLHLLLNNPIVWLLVVPTVVILIYYQHCQKEADDAEDDYDSLREEVIDRSWEIWPKELDSAQRDKVMRYLLDQEDINLYFK